MPQKNKPRIAGESQEYISDFQDLILYNDDVNDFDYVIETLVDVCDHDYVQAEQCALIAHYKGKCGIMNGTFTELKPLWQEITNRGISVEII